MRNSFTIQEIYTTFTSKYLKVISNFSNGPNRKIWPDVKPIEQFWVRKEGKQVNVWMGSKGVTAQAHYDASYNFFVQIMGR